MLYLGSKRCIDLLGAVTAIIVFSPVFLILAVLIRAENAGPVFFRQQRLGLNGRLFQIYKFRSMYQDAEQRLHNDPNLYKLYIENGFKLPNGLDPRITRVGHFLRKTSLDELPQLINVVLGQMSLVGPRPIVSREIDEYGDRGNEFLSVKPGMTGYWQVLGRADLQYPERVDVELYYVRHRSLILDLWILARTPFSVLARKGAF